MSRQQRRASGSKSFVDILQGWFGHKAAPVADREAIERGEEVAVSCFLPGPRMGRWRWWRQGVLVLGESEAWWRPWPQLGRRGVPLGELVYGGSRPVSEHQLNLKRHLFSVITLGDGSLTESEIAVPTGDVHLVEWWCRRVHHD